MSDDRLRFIERAVQVHGDRYDYAKFVYRTYQTKGIIICRIHGPFEKSPEKHINRQQGCKDCSSLVRAMKRTSTVDSFVGKACDVHGHAFDYSEFVYVNSTTPGKIRCKAHDILFEQTPSHHLSGHCSCVECIRLKSQGTHLERYGAEHHSRTAVFRDKVKQTSLERFGVAHHSQTPDFRTAMIETSLEKYGVEFASQSPDFQERRRQTSQAKYGAPHRNMSHISEAALAILGSKEALVNLLRTKSIDDAAALLGVSDCTVGRYCHAYDIELSQSTAEDALCAFLRGHGVKVIRKNRTLIRLEIDIILPEYQIGIEYGALYWHREIIRPKDYHIDKLRRMHERGYRLITIFEDELLHKRDIVESRLLNLVGKSVRGKGARQLTIRSIDPKPANHFLNLYHIQGVGTGGFVRYGAFDGTQLVAVMTFSRPRVALGRTTGADELLRFATDGKSYPGAASRMFQTFVREHQPDRVISYADRRWSEGNLYQQLGFSLLHETGPNYWYIGKHRSREHRFNYRKDRIAHLVENGNAKTEREIMLELGRDRIWDCGSLKFEWIKGDHVPVNGDGVRHPPIVDANTSSTIV